MDYTLAQITALVNLGDAMRSRKAYSRDRLLNAGHIGFHRFEDVVRLERAMAAVERAFPSQAAKESADANNL